MRSPAPSQSSLLRVLYVVATLPFILFAILYFTGAFRRPQPDQPAPPSTRPAATSSSANQSSAAPDSEAAARIDTAPKHPPGKNAADFYKQAYGLYKALDLTKEEKKLLTDRSGNWDKEKAKALFEKIQPIMNMLRQSQEAVYADWGIRLEGMDKGFPIQVADAVRFLGQVISWNAAYEMPMNSFQAASDLQIEHRLGSSVGEEGIFGMMLSGTQHQIIIETFRNHAQQLSPDARSLAIVMFTYNQQSNSLAAAMKAESSIVTRMADDLLQGKNPPGHYFVDSDMPSPAELAGQMNLAATIENDFSTKALLPDPQFQNWWQGIQQSVADQAMAKIVLNVLIAFREKYAQTAVQTSMLQAGLSILDHMDSALAKYPDPTTGQPFQLAPTADGFELRSAYQYKGKPVIMAFPTAKP